MVFNLKKYSQMTQQPLQPPMAVDPMDADPMTEEQPVQDQVNQTGEYTEDQKQQRIASGDFETFPFIDEGDLSDYMNEAGEEIAQQNLLASARGIDNANSLGSFIQGFYAESPENKLRYAAANIWPMLDDSVKMVRPENGVNEAMGDQGSMETPVNNTEKVEVVMPTVAESNKEIQKLAQKHSKEAKKSKGFNLSKYAQHKTVEELVLHGPGSKRISPFTGELESDWHVIERNKGWGYRVGDLWNLDFEQFWRQNIMDKYSRPYRDADGNWVGGYIQKRFEVDKWVPEENNLQYKPGQHRKPYLPENRSTEARLEAMRAKKDRGYGPDSDGEPYDWNKKPEYAETKIASKGFNLKQHKEAQFEEQRNPMIHEQEQQLMNADDSMPQPEPTPIQIDEWRQNKVNQLAESQGRTPDEMLKIILDKGLGAFSDIDSGFGQTMASSNQKKKVALSPDYVNDNPMAPLDQGVNAVKKKAFCPICGCRCGKLQGSDQETVCPDHGVVNPDYKGYESHAPDAPGKQKPDQTFMPSNVPLTAAVLDKNQLDGHPEEKGDGTIDYLKEWSTDDDKHFEGSEEVNSDKKTIIITVPSLDQDDEDFEFCDHGCDCPHVNDTWLVLLGDDR